jgi:hypothetical protein
MLGWVGAVGQPAAGLSTDGRRQEDHMLGTTIGQANAHGLLACGSIQLALGLAVATGLGFEPRPGAHSGNDRSGEAIDGGLIHLLAGAARHVMTTVSRSLCKSATSSTPR